MNPSGGECRGDRSGRPVQRTNTTRPTNEHPNPTESVYQNDIIFPILTSYFPDLPFSGNAHFRKIVPIRKSRVKYFKTRPSKHIRMNIYSHNYTVSNAKKTFAEPLFTVESTGCWLRTDVSAPPYRRVRTVVRTRPYENNHLSPFFRDRRGTISDV